MLNEHDVEEIQIKLLKLGKAIDSGQGASDLLIMVADTLESLRKKQSPAS